MEPVTNLAMPSAELFDLATATVRLLSVDGVERAQSGHPGTPMALAGVALEIWLRHLRYDPECPEWVDRDRFVLSCGHASMLLYSMLHLAGYAVSLDDLKAFRKWGSITPGHPERGMTPGVETTTGPLGQGFANAVGMAIALKIRQASHPKLTKARVFGICSDGDLMEGVSAEAASIAGHLGLDNLLFVYDDNKITIDGGLDLSFSEDVAMRFRASGWDTWTVDGHDVSAFRATLDAATASTGKPKLIVTRTRIGIGTPTKENSHKAHGEPLGASEVRGTKERLGFSPDETFVVPPQVRDVFRARAEQGKRERAAWQERLAASSESDRTDFAVKTSKKIPANLFEELCAAAPMKEAATRVSAGLVEQRVAALVPQLLGGSADLNPSTKTFIEGAGAIARGAFSGRNIHFGIREHAMGSILNGLAMTEGCIPFGSTFLVFSDYMRPTIRIAALSHLQSLFIFTHDSLYLGEDGPTHQPVEHLWSLRLIPNVDVVRPADGLECAAAWYHAISRTNGPTVFALSRQNLPVIDRGPTFDKKDLLSGATIVAHADDPTLVIIATGSEVSLALAAKPILEAAGERVRVVSMWCRELFLRSASDEQDRLLPRSVPRVSLELGISTPWLSLVGATGLAIGHDTFGASAPAPVIAEKLGFTPEGVAARIKAWRARS